MTAYFVGCDVGTSGTKSVVMRDDGAVVGADYVEYPLITRKDANDRFPGPKAEHDPESYWTALADTIQSAIRQSGVESKSIKGVSVSALSPACILVNKELQPLQRAHIWMDRRGTAESQQLAADFGEETFFQVSACRPDPYYGAVKLLWEKNNRPDLYKQAFKVQSAADFARMRLIGRAVTDYSNASLMGLFYNVVDRQWNNSLAEAVGIDPDKLPEPYPCDEVVGDVNRAAAERTGLLAGTPVMAGTVDCTAAWLAAGAVATGATQLVMGTAGSLGVIHEKPIFTREMITTVHTAHSRSLYATVGSIVSCGALLRWFRDEFAQIETAATSFAGRTPFEMLDEQASHVPPGCDGLIVLPYFMGERTPIWDTHARGVFFGLTLNHGRAHQIRALMEGAAYALRHNYEIMKARGLPLTSPIVLSEGGAKSELWRQIVADVLDVECVLAESSPGAPVGNAINAGVGVGIFKGYEVANNFVRLSEPIRPRVEYTREYDRLYAIYRDLYSAVRPLFRRL